MDDWRKPIIGHPEEVAGQFARPGERALLWYVSEEDRERIRRKMACASCLCPFPAPPEKRNLHIWRGAGALTMWSAARSPEEVERLICAEKCPGCQSDVSDQMTRLMDVGDDYNNDPDRYKRLHEDLEREIAAAEKLKALGLVP